MTELKANKSDLIYRILMIVSSVAIPFAAGFLYKIELLENYCNILIVAVLVIAMMFTISLEKNADRFLFDNKNGFWRFFIVFEIGLIVSAVLPLFPNSGWIYLPIFISLMLFSSELTGTVSGVLLLTISSLLSPNADIVSYLVFMIPGIVGIMLFSTIDEEFKVFVPMTVSLGFQLVFLCIKDVLLANRVFSFQLFLLPLINIIISVAILLFVLKMFSFSLIYKSHDKYIDIIDPEFDLLVSLKKASKEDYDHAIYTAVLCAKLAKEIGISENVTKACGYYHRIGVLASSNNWEDVCPMLTDYQIPQDVIELLREYIDPDTPIKSKEAVVVMFADTVVSSIRYLFMKDKDSAIDYEKLINAIFDKKIKSGVISDSKISFEDLNKIKKLLIEDKLFYDFLR